MSTYRNFGTFMIFKPDVFATRLLGFGVCVFSDAMPPWVHLPGAVKIGGWRIALLHPWK